MRLIPEEERKQIHSALEMSIEKAPKQDSLYFHIGWYYLGGNMMDPSGWTSIGLTTSFLRQLRGTLFEKVCLEWDFCAKRNEPDLQDTINLVAAIADAIATLTLKIPPILISAILVKKGLTSFCVCDKESILRQLASNDEDQREWAVYAVASLKPEDSIDILRRTRTDTSVIVRAAIAYTLGQINSHESEEFLWSMAKTDRSALVRRYSIEVISSFSQGSVQARLIELGRLLIQEEDEHVISTIYSCIKKCESNAILDFVFASFPKLKTSYIKRDAYEIIAKSQQQKATNFILKEYPSETDWHARLELIVIIRDLDNNKRYLDLLTSATKDENWLIRMNACKGLSGFVDPKVIMQLETLANNDPVDQVREAAKKALEENQNG